VAYASGVQVTIRPRAIWAFCPALVALLALLAMGGCHRAPRREIERARLDLAAAIRAQAPMYAPASFQEARRALEGATKLVSEKRYRDAKTLALEASSRAKGSVEVSDENRKKMLAALRLKIDTTERKLADASDERKLAQARGVDDNAQQLFGSELVEARTRQDEARRRLESQDLIGGKKWADDADVATEALLRDIRFSITRKQSEVAPRKSSRKKAR